MGCWFSEWVYEYEVVLVWLVVWGYLVDLLVVELMLLCSLFVMDEEFMWM